VRHLAIRARCINSTRPYTTPGLGDRIHSVILGWVYGPPVTLHLTADQWRGGQFSNKPESWREIVDLFPAGSVQVCHHAVSPATEREWLGFLSGYEVEPYSYLDYRQPHDTVLGFDIAPYLKRIPLLSAQPVDIELPERFVTVQWDSNSVSRSVPLAQREMVIARYRAEGYTPVTVGGESKDDRLRWSLKHIAYAMSKAAFHVGVDSAFFHMAQLYMPWERIHLYHGSVAGHHVLRARDNGARINPYL
jgi:hypothetical protein